MPGCDGGGYFLGMSASRIGSTHFCFARSKTAKLSANCQTAQLHPCFSNCRATKAVQAAREGMSAFSKVPNSPMYIGLWCCLDQALTFPNSCSTAFISPSAPVQVTPTLTGAEGEMKAVE